MALCDRDGVTALPVSLLPTRKKEFASIIGANSRWKTAASSQSWSNHAAGTKTSGRLITKAQLRSEKAKRRALGRTATNFACRKRKARCYEEMKRRPAAHLAELQLRTTELAGALLPLLSPRKLRGNGEREPERVEFG